MGRYFCFCLTCGLLAMLTACAGLQSTRSGAVSVPDPYIEDDQIFSNLSFDPIPLPDSLFASGSSHQILQEARKRLTVALAALERGDTAATRIVIDDILGLMVVLSDIDDPTVAQERDDMLKRISGLIDDLQAGRELAQIRKGEIPQVTNERVERQIKWFMQKNRNGIRVAYTRAGRYGDMIRRELSLRGLPQELQWLPVIESAYHPLAYSWANAAGLWQFIPETGKRYGLRRTSWVDDRMDPYKASQAAAAYLSDLYDMFGDWLLAVAAYNCGEERVLKAVNRSGTKDYWKLKLPRETSDYVPRFLAAVAIIEHPEQYDITFPDPMAAYVFEEARIEKSIALADAARVLGVSHDQLKSMNTGIRNGVIPPGGYDLRVPLGTGSTLLARLSEIPEAQYTVVTQTGSYKVKRGDSLGRIASRHGTSVAALKKLNHLKNNRLQVGQRLELPGKPMEQVVIASAAPKASKASAVAASTATRTTPANRKENANRATIAHKVRPGDTLGDIAEYYQVSLSSIRKANPRVKPGRLSIGQTVVVPGVKEPEIVTVSSTPPAQALNASSSVAATPSKEGAVAVAAASSSDPRVYVVQQGDSIWSIARQYGLSVVDVLQLNQLKRGATILPGQILKLATGTGGQPLGGRGPAISTQSINTQPR